MSARSRTEGELSLVDVLGALRRRSWVLGGGLVVGIGLALAVTLRFPPTYRAEARVLVEAPSSASSLLAYAADLPLGVSGVLGGPATAAEMEVLRSRPVVRGVVGPRGSSEVSPDTGLDLAVRVDDLDTEVLWRQYLRRLRGEPEPVGTLGVTLTAWDLPETHEDPIRIEFLAADEVELAFDRWFDRRTTRRTFAPGEALEFEGARFVLAPEGELAGRRFALSRKSFPRAMEDFQDELVVKETQRGTNVLAISCGARTRARAAEVTNALVRAYMAVSRARAVRRADRSVEYMEREIERVHGELRTAEENLAEFGRRAGKVALPENALALVEALTEVDLERARLELETRRIADLSRRLGTGELSLESLAGLERSGLLGESEVTPLAELLATRAVLRGSYTEEWPELARTQREIEERGASIAETLGGITDQNRAEVRDLDRILAELVQELEGMPEVQVELVRHTRRIEATGQIYLFLLAQLQESRITMATAVPAVEVIEWAVPPLRRSSPSLRTNLAVGAVLGLFLGGCLATLRELRRSVVDLGRLSEIARAPGLGAISRARTARPLVVRDRPRSRAADEVRTLRAGLAAAPTKVRSLAVSSATPREGRSRTAANLALAWAQAGERVLLVDADLRAPVQARWFGRAAEAGLGEALEAGGVEWRDAVHSTGAAELDLLAAGRSKTPFADLVARGALWRLLAEAAQDYDRIVVDTGAVLAGADGAAAAAACDGTLLLCRAGRVPEVSVAEASARLERAGARTLGVLMNGGRAPRWR